MHLKDYSLEHQLNMYLHLIKVTLRIRNELKTDVHPNALTKYQNEYNNIAYHLVSLILDVIKIPEERLTTRTTYHDFIVEHIERNTIKKEHLIKMLISWENFDIIEQAD